MKKILVMLMCASFASMSFAVTVSASEPVAGKPTASAKHKTKNHHKQKASAAKSSNKKASASVAK